MKLLTNASGFDIIITLGKTAEKNATKYLSNRIILCLPHPSGRNFQLNDNDFITLQLDRVKEILDGKIRDRFVLEGRTTIPSTCNC